MHLIQTLVSKLQPLHDLHLNLGELNTLDLRRKPTQTRALRVLAPWGSVPALGAPLSCAFLPTLSFLVALATTRAAAGRTGATLCFLAALLRA